MTSAEEKLWNHLRDRRLNGMKFVRQASIGPYFADFLCRQLKLIVEIDGATHSTEAEMANDGKRATDLEASGYRIFRAWNDEIYENIEGVLEALAAVMDEMATREAGAGTCPSP